MHNNIDLSSETYEDIATGKLQIHHALVFERWRQFTEKRFRILIHHTNGIAEKESKKNKEERKLNI